MKSIHHSWGLCIILLLLVCTIELSAVAQATIAKPGCMPQCGNNVAIPYPFGIGANCSMGESFTVICNNSRPFIRSINMEVTGFSMEGLFEVMTPVISSNCGPSSSTSRFLSVSPYQFSSWHNKFTVTGCDNSATIYYEDDKIVSWCRSTCDAPTNTSVNATDGCHGTNCCQSEILPGLDSVIVSITSDLSFPSESRCAAFIVEKDWYVRHDVAERERLEQVATVLTWASFIGDCQLSETSVQFCTKDGFCWGELTSDFLCICSSQDQNMETVNFTLSDDGCRDARSCFRTYKQNGSLVCNLHCVIKPGHPFCNNCRPGKEMIPHECIVESTEPASTEPASSSQVKRFPVAILAGCLASVGMLFMLVALWWLYKVVKRREHKKIKQNNFRRNGGLLMQQQLYSIEGNVEKAKLFTSKELEKASDNYNQNRILGRGGQGTVYKGMLIDGRIVAIKKSKILDENQLEQFINEVIILSQINHRNVVKLLGCCLETEVPLLVYEFIPNGTLFHVLHHQIEEFQLTWEMRVRIAIEVASALSYLHSSASIPIYHRDIKSSNILLDDKYRAKVSDFGTSRSIAIDKTHLTTRVMGTFGYLDPEFFRSSQFTEKSDVYSFGVVLVELLTGKKPISSDESEDDRSLTMNFLLLLKKNRLLEILDARVVKEGSKEDIMAVARLARRCLNLNGRKRPTMREVTTVLEGIRVSQETVISFQSQQSFEEVHSGGEISEAWDDGSSSDAETYTQENSALG